MGDARRRFRRRRFRRRHSGCAFGAPLPRPRGIVAVALRAHADAHRPRARLERERAQLPRLQRRAQSPAPRLSLGRFGGSPTGSCAA
jgi:hypothetical protein